MNSNFYKFTKKHNKVAAFDLDDEGDDTCNKIQRRYPAWKFGEGEDARIYVGVVERETMEKLLKQENQIAKQKKAQSGLLQ